jgi:hypothetical protein
MTTHATAPRLAAEPVPHPIESVLAEPGHRRCGAPADLTPILVRYWQEMPHAKVDERAQWLDGTRARVRSGETTTRAFALHALGDVDEQIVFGAAFEYVAAHPVSIERRQAAVDDAADWIRRGLALNRGAVFAALLSLGDASVNGTLGGLRLSLTHAEIGAVCRHAVARPSRATRTFLAEWLALLDACDEPDLAARALVAAALAT